MYLPTAYIHIMVYFRRPGGCFWSHLILIPPYHWQLAFPIFSMGLPRWICICPPLKFATMNLPPLEPIPLHVNVVFYCLQDHIKSYKPTDHSVLVKKNPFSSLTISDRQEDRREKKRVSMQSSPSPSSQLFFIFILLIISQVSSQSHRFKVVSKHRCLNDLETQDEMKSDPTAR